MKVQEKTRIALEDLHLLAFKQVYPTSCRHTGNSLCCVLLIGHGEYWGWGQNQCFSSQPWVPLRGQGTSAWELWAGRELESPMEAVRWKAIQSLLPFFPLWSFFYSMENVHWMWAGLSVTDAWCVLCFAGLRFFFPYVIYKRLRKM